MGKRIALAVTNDLATDQRVQRTISVLLDLGFEVTFIGRQLPGSLPFNPTYKTRRFKLPFTRGALFYAAYNLRLFGYLIAKKFDYYLVNDLDTLLAMGLAAQLKRIPFVYDSHEFFTGSPEIQDRPNVIRTWRWIEKKFYGKAIERITVNQSIAELLQSTYGGDPPKVVRNIGMRPDHVAQKSRQDLGLPEDAFILINQGSGINMDRGMEEALLAIKDIDKAVLLIVGGGDVIPYLKQQVAERNLDGKVIFVNKVPYAELLSYTRLADCGLSLDKPKSINYKFSLPNKLFDYLHSGIPVISSQVVEVKRIVEEFEVGYTVDSSNVPQLAVTIQKMMNADREQFFKGIQRAQKELNWDQERKVLEVIFTPLLNVQK